MNESGQSLVVEDNASIAFRCSHSFAKALVGLVLSSLATVDSA
jgi:hypothetical protein